MDGSYDFNLVLLSYLVAATASYSALDLAGRVTQVKGPMQRYWLAGGAFAMGTGIWAMHFIGMLAFRLPIDMGYSIGMTVASWIIAIAVSGFALYVVSRDHLSWRNLGVGAVVMGAGISAMHYTGMGAMQIMPGLAYDPIMVALSMAIAVGAGGAALWIAFSLRREHSGRGILLKIGSAIVMAFAITGMHYTGMAATHIAANSVCTVRGVVHNEWMGLVLGVGALSLLKLSMVLSALDVRFSSRTAELNNSLRRANSELKHLTLHDALTQLPNRVLLEDRLEQAVARAQRAHSRCAVLFVDLDGFKTINDSLGHHVGDGLLKEAAARMRGLVRDEDTVARLSGDEFVILLDNVNGRHGALEVGQKVNTALASAFGVEGHELRISASIGLSVCPEDGTDARRLLMNADAAMYYAKACGKNNSQAFAPHMSNSAEERLNLQNSLRAALERGEFELHYQPKMTEGGEVLGMEALVRWRHPERGMVSPGEFIPIAEESGLIVPLGEWILREACRQNKAWQDAGLPPLRVGVNISAVQFMQRDLLDKIKAILRETGLAPQYLKIELTESVVMRNADDATRVLQKLKAMGVHIALDDFGTGYSSLSYLRRLPIDVLKIDQSFVRDLGREADDTVIVRAIVALAHSLNMRVVAEGVETAEQLALLRSMQVNEYQGYFFSRPVPADAMTAMLAKQSAPAVLRPSLA